MMKRILVIPILAALVAIPCEAGRPRKKSPKAGKTKDNIYTDSKYGLSLELPGGWWTKIQKDEKQCRLILEQKSYDVSTTMSQYRDKFGPPTARIWMVEMPFASSELVDSLLSETYESDIKTELLYNLDEPTSTLQADEYKTTNRTTVKLDTSFAVVWQGTVKYTFGTIRVRDVKLSGGIIAVEHGDRLLVVVAQGYPKSFDHSFGQITHMIRSLKWE